jgi:hypothetical protein
MLCVMCALGVPIFIIAHCELRVDFAVHSSRLHLLSAAAAAFASLCLIPSHPIPAVSQSVSVGDLVSVPVACAWGVVTGTGTADV